MDVHNHFLALLTYRNCSSFCVFFVSVRDMMEYMGFVISYDDDDDNSYGSLPLLRFLACLVPYSLAITVNCFFC